MCYNKIYIDAFLFNSASNGFDEKIMITKYIYIEVFEFKQYIYYRF